MRLHETIAAAHEYIATRRTSPPRQHDAAVAIVELCHERNALRELLAETLRPGAYGIGSTLAQRIATALGQDAVARPLASRAQAPWPFPEQPQAPAGAAGDFARMDWPLR